MINWIIGHPEFCSAVIALIALFRPEISSFFHHWKAEVDFHIRPSKKILINFRGQPQCWIDGSLESVCGNNLIGDMSVKITRQRDNATHVFEWVLWESTMLGDQRASPAYAFQLYQNTTMNGLFSFRDDTTAALYATETQQLREGFENYLKTVYPAPSAFPDELQPDFEAFRKGSGSALVTAAFVKIQRAMCWEAGRYLGKFTIHSKRPKKDYVFKFEFELSPQDHSLLDQNPIRALWQAAGLKNVTFNQAEPNIEKFTRLKHKS